MTTRVQRALSVADMDALARSRGLKSAEDHLEHLRLFRRLGGGGRITAQDIERTRERNPHIPLEAFNQLADWVNQGATGRDRANRYSDAVAQAVGAPDPMAVREIARVEAEALAVHEMAYPLTRRLDEHDATRDRHAGIDSRERVEAAKRAAQNPEAIRRNDIEREIARHEGPRAPLYTHDRREILAQGHDRIAERIRSHQVRDTDPNRLPDRGDDRRDDIALEFDRLTVEEMSRDELALASNPLLENLDNAITSTTNRDE